MDRSRKAALIQVYNAKTSVKPLELIYEIEIYINFSDTFSRLSTKEKNIISFVYHKRYFAFEFPNEAQGKFFTNAIKALEETCTKHKDMVEKLKQQTKNINKPKKGGFFSGVK